jgi:hypothetical protein
MEVEILAGRTTCVIPTTGSVIWTPAFAGVHGEKETGGEYVAARKSGMQERREACSPCP